MSTIYDTDDGRRIIEDRYRARLDAWPVPHTELRVPTTAGETFVVVSGPADAPPLLALHGSGANTSAWRGDIADWSAHFRVYAVDLLGEPGFSAPNRLDLDTDATASWLDEVLDGLYLDTTALVGMSLGGWTALDYVLRRPGRITRLALLCPGGLGKHRYAWLVKTLALRTFARRSDRDAVRAGLGLPADDPATEEILDEIETTFTHFSPRPGNLPRFHPTQLSEVTIPVLIIAGTKDALFDTKATARLARALPHGQVTLLPGVGHAILGQTEPIRKFLQDN